MTYEQEAAAVGARADQEIVLTIAEIGRLSEVISALKAQHDADMATIVSLQQQLADCQEPPPPPPPPSGKPLLGLWPGDGKDIDRLKSAEAKLGRPFAIYRERGGRGRLNEPMVKAGGLQIAQRGTTLSLDLQCRLFASGVVKPVPYVDVTAGKYDTNLRRLATEAKAIPGGPHVIELQSEANIDSGGSQPYSGTAAEFKAFFRYVVEFFKAEGVTNLRYVLTVTKKVYDGKDGGTTAWIGGIEDVVDIISVDGYSTPVENFAGTRPGTRNTPDEIAGKAYAYAKSIGKPFMVCETGSQDDPNYPTYKPAWYGEWATWLNTHPGVYAVVHNYSTDGIAVPYEQSWPFDSTPASLDAFKTMVEAAYG